MRDGVGDAGDGHGDDGDGDNGDGYGDNGDGDGCCPMTKDFSMAPNNDNVSANDSAQTNVYRPVTSANQSQSPPPTLGINHHHKRWELCFCFRCHRRHCTSTIVLFLTISAGFTLHHMSCVWGEEFMNGSVYHHLLTRLSLNYE